MTRFVVRPWMVLTVAVLGVVVAFVLSGTGSDQAPTLPACRLDYTVSDGGHRYHVVELFDDGGYLIGYNTEECV